MDVLSNDCSQATRSSMLSLLKFHADVKSLLYAQFIDMPYLKMAGDTAGMSSVLLKWDNFISTVMIS